MSVNKVILMGRLGQEPEINHVSNGTKVAKFSLATSERYKDRSGNLVENTEWHNVEAWDKLADIIEQYVHKGDMIYLEGKIRTEKWQDKEGNNRYTTKIRMTDLTLLPKSNPNQNQTAQTQKTQNQSNVNPIDEEPPIDDVPF